LAWSVKSQPSYQLILSYLPKTRTVVDLPYLPNSISSIPLKLYSSNLKLTVYYDNIIRPVPFLRHFTTLALAQGLVRLQLFKEYSLQEYPVQ
jgi:hypothetical protein